MSVAHRPGAELIETGGADLEAGTVSIESLLVSIAAPALGDVVFVDYECPFCKLYHGHLESLLSEVKPSFAVSVRDFPLPSHPGASLAAAAAACLEKSVGYSVLARSLYSWQDSTFPPDMDALLASIGEYAADSKECVRRTDSEATRDSMVALAARFGVSGTPTVIVDRRQYRLPPSREELRRLLNDD